MRTVPERLRTIKDDPWAGFFAIRQTISKTMATSLERSSGPART